MQSAAAFVLLQHQLTGAHIGAGQAPTEGLLALGRLHHHRRQPVVAAGAEHAFLQHRARREHAGDVTLEQRAFGAALGWSRLKLVAERHAAPFANQISAVALRRMVRNARHRHPADRLASFFASEGELEQPGEFDRILEEALEEIPQSIEQNAIGMGGLQLHVVTQHRCELTGVHQAVVTPSRQVVFGFSSAVLVWGAALLGMVVVVDALRAAWCGCGVCCLAPVIAALPRPGSRIGREGLVIQLALRGGAGIALGGMAGAVADAP